MQASQGRTSTCELTAADLAETLYMSAVRKLRDGDAGEAEKLLLQAEGYHPTAQAKSLLDQIRNRKPLNRESKASTSRGAEYCWRRTPSSDSNTKQQETVSRVLNCNNHYEILGLEKEASTEQIKEAYKKLALVLHPDKNKTPGANQAFQALANAKDVLLDPRKRKEYDIKLRVAKVAKGVAWAVVGGVAIIGIGLIGLFTMASTKKNKDNDDYGDMYDDSDSED